MRAIVTGAASGIGRACALKCAAAATARGEEAVMLLVDIQTSALTAVVEELNSLGATAFPLICDLAKPDAGQAVAAEALRRLGSIDVLVSNAGVIRPSALCDTALEDYEFVFAVNTRATWLLAKACYPLLKAARGVLVATGSVSGVHQTSPYGAYSASKAALIMLVRQLAYEWAADGARCNTVSPGNIHTGMNDALYADPDALRRRTRMIPLGRLGKPEDIANAVAFLASPQAAYITGVDLVVDGGMCTTLMPHMKGSDVYMDAGVMASPSART